MSKDTQRGAYRRRGLDRRDVLKGLAGATALSALPHAAFAQAAKEAPALAKLAADGKLPPLAERLLGQSAGHHGREGRHAMAARCGAACAARSDHNGILRMVGNQGLVRWNLAFTEVAAQRRRQAGRSTPNSTEFTFYLRKGMKWSDGKPFTADDIVFSIEDCAKNTELYKSVPSPLVIGGKPGTVDARSTTTTVKFTFASPYALFLEQMATPLGPAPDAVRQALLQPVPSRSTTRASPTWSRRPTCPTGRTLFRAKCGDIEIPVALGQSRQADARPVGDQGALYRRRDARRDGAQSLFLAGRHRGQPAALYRPAQLQHLAGRRVADARRDFRHASTSRSAISTRCRTSRRCRRTCRRATTA